MTAALPKIRFGTGPASRAALRRIPVAERLASPQYGLLWLVRLRWHALVALAVAMTLAPLLMGVVVPWLPALLLVGGLGLSNLARLAWVRPDRPVRTGSIGVVLLGDTALLTAALHLSRGELNLFVPLHLVQVALAALLLGAVFGSSHRRSERGRLRAVARSAAGPAPRLARRARSRR